MTFLRHLKTILINCVAMFLRNISDDFKWQAKRSLEEECRLTGKLSARGQFVEHLVKLLKAALQSPPEANLLLCNRPADREAALRQYFVVSAHVGDDCSRYIG